MDSSSLSYAQSRGDEPAGVPLQAENADQSTGSEQQQRPAQSTSAPRAASLPLASAEPLPSPPSAATPLSPVAGSAPSRVKVVYFIRHAESAYNAYKLSPLNWLTLRALSDPMILDPPLSAVGLTQLSLLSATAAKWKLTEKAQLLVVSPLRRALDTALAVMGQAVPAAGQQAQRADSAGSTYPLPVYVSPLCTEVVDTSADIGSSPAVLSSAYPGLSFSHLPTAWWYHKDAAHPIAIHDEPKERVAHRVSSFLQWLCRREESCIVVVSHSSFIRHCTGARLKIANCQVQECAVQQQRDGRIQVTVVREALQ